VTVVEARHCADCGWLNYFADLDPDATPPCPDCGSPRSEIVEIGPAELDGNPPGTERLTGERSAEPGETCTCGRPAVIVYLTEKHGPVPWCGLDGVPDDEPQDDGSAR